mgnify:CR=1 FL=1
MTGGRLRHGRSVSAHPLIALATRHHPCLDERGQVVWQADHERGDPDYGGIERDRRVDSDDSPAAREERRQRAAAGRIVTLEQR